MHHRPRKSPSARACARVFLILTAILTGACDTATPPSAPTGTAIGRNEPTVVTVAIETDRQAQSPHRATQYKATARLSDGSVLDVTPAAAWESSNPAVATVEAGLVRWVTSGEATLRAAYRGMVGQLHVGVTIFENQTGAVVR